MSKSNIPICKLPDEECNILFKSVVDKLKIEKPTFFYPIYKKLVSNDSMNPEDLQNYIIDSKYKCKEILEKLVDSDDDEVFDSDDEKMSDDSESDNEENIKKSSKQIEEIDIDIEEIDIDTNKIKNQYLDTDTDPDISLDSDDESNKNILNEEIKDIPIEDQDNNEEMELDNYNTYDDKEIEEAISNTYMAMAMIEKEDKSTGKKICKEEMIHIKKTALLDPLKVMKDEYIIPSKIKNQNMNDDSLKNTMSKLNSYNNCGHVESLFLYLGNKLVETGKCPSFPYYYGCINGEDPNYHHNITDEYESVSRTKWFKDRVKNDFDLLIIEDGDVDACNEEYKKIKRPSNTCNKNRRDTDTDTDTEADSDKEDSDKEDSDKEPESDKEDSDKQDAEDDVIETCQNTCDLSKQINLSAEELSLTLDKQFEPIAKKIVIEENNNNTNTDGDVNLTFIKDMDCEDLELSLDDNDNDINVHQMIFEGGGLYKKNKCGEDCNEDCNEECNEDCSDDCSGCDSDDFIEELSDVDKDNLSMTDFEDKPGNMYYIKCENMPVSLSLMEKLDDTLDNILDDDYNMSETEWFSMFFQVSFGLAIAQKYFNFVHNDLHSSNVMFKKTLIKYLYYQVGNNYYRIPTYSKITKIIDFARGTFKFGDRWVFSDQFKADGDAHGQYDYPVDGSLKNCEHKPNPSFDLVRLGTTVIQRLENLPKVREFVEQITLDDYDNSVCYDEDTFDLYIDIARNCHKAIPLEVMERKEFEQFKINKNKIPKGQYVFKY
jgi:hypothetical protein